MRAAIVISGIPTFAVLQSMVEIRGKQSRPASGRRALEGHCEESGERLRACRHRRSGGRGCRWAESAQCRGHCTGSGSRRLDARPADAAPAPSSPIARESGRGPVAISPLQYGFSRLRHSAKNRLEDRPSIEARTGIREQERSKGQLCLSRWRALRFSEQVKRWAGAPRENGPAQVEKPYPCANTAFSLPPRPEQFRPRPASAGYG